jgi:hypothetical protein
MIDTAVLVRIAVIVSVAMAVALWVSWQRGKRVVMRKPLKKKSVAPRWCRACNGSGKGLTPDTRCKHCAGSGLKR